MDEYIQIKKTSMRKQTFNKNMQQQMLRSLGADLQIYKDSYEKHLITEPNKEL